MRGRAEQHFKIARLCDVASHRDDARNQWFAVCDGAINAVCRADIETLRAQVGGAHACRDFDTGEYAYQLFCTAPRIQGRHGDDFHPVCTGASGAGIYGQSHGGDGFGFVVLDANQHFLGIQHITDDFCALDDFFGAFAHQQVIAGDVGFALRAVQHHGFNLVFAGAQFLVAGEGRAAQPDHARHAQHKANIGLVDGQVVHAFAFDPFFLAVWNQGDAQVVHAGSVGDLLHVYGSDRAGSGRMNRAGQAAFRHTDDLSLAYALTDFDRRFGAIADMLIQRNDQPGGQRGLGYRALTGLLFVGGRMYATVEFE